MKLKQNTTLALAAALFASLAAVPAMAADNPFAAPSAGYKVAADEMAKGKCGATMGMGDSTKAEAGKTTTEKAVTEKPKAKKKAKAKKDAAAKCGEGKCGAAMGMSEQDKAAMPKSDEKKCGASKK